MAQTTKQTKTPATPGFAIEIKDDTELGLAILVAVYAAGGYRPIGASALSKTDPPVLSKSDPGVLS